MIKGKNDPQVLLANDCEKRKLLSSTISLAKSQMDVFFHHADLLSVWNRHTGPWFCLLWLQPMQSETHLPNHQNRTPASCLVPKKSTCSERNKKTLETIGDIPIWPYFFWKHIRLTKRSASHDIQWFILPPANIMTPSKIKIVLCQNLWCIPFFPFQIPFDLTFWRSLYRIFFRNETHFGLLEISSSSTCLDTIAVASNLTNKKNNQRNAWCSYMQQIIETSKRLCVCIQKLFILYTP